MLQGDTGPSGKIILVDLGSERFLKTGRDAARAYFQKILASIDFEIFSKLGGVGYVTWANVKGVMSTRNYQDTHFDNSGQLDGQQLKAAISGSWGCTNCPIRFED
jgi:aldehyde:ferredoxin oxidoreductase